MQYAALALWPICALGSEAIVRKTESRAIEVAHSRTSPRDLGVKLLPSCHTAIHRPDAAQLTLTVLLLASMAACVGSLEDAMDLVCRFALAHSTLLLMRATTIASTVTGIACPNAAVKDGGMLNAGKYDLMFSGHTTMGTLLMVFAIHLWEWHPASIAVGSVLAVGNSALQVSVGDHFTVSHCFENAGQGPVF